MSTTLKLTAEQWAVVSPILHKKTRETRGRKRNNDKSLFEAALYFLANEGTTWRSLPNDVFPPYQSCFRQSKEWDSRGLIMRAIEALAQDLEERGGVPLCECFMDKLFRDGIPVEPMMIIDGGPICIDEPPPGPWEIATREYFESRRIWILLYRSRSEWVRTRIPLDLRERIQSIL